MTLTPKQVLKAEDLRHALIQIVAGKPAAAVATICFIALLDSLLGAPPSVPEVSDGKAVGA